MMRLDHLTDGAMTALEKRGIDVEIAVALGVISVRPGRGDSREWIGFRHEVDGSEGDHWAYRTITGDKAFFQSPGTARRLWNNQVIRDHSLEHMPLIITEGQLDALSLMTVGYRRVVSVPDGAPVQASDPGEGKTKYAYLQGCGLEPVREIILATDADNPGKALLQDLALRLGRSRCKWLDYGTGRKDTNDVLVQDGVEGVLAAITDARWMELDGIYTLKDLPPEPDEEAIDIGIQGLDELWKLARGRLSVLTGMPGHGKSTLITDVACHIAERHGLVIAIASFEDTLRGSLVPRLQRWYLRGDPRYLPEEKLAEANAWIERHFVFIEPRDDADDTPTVSWYLERARAAVVRYNAGMVILDPWNSMDHTAGEEEVSLSEYVGVMLGKLRRHAKACRYASVVIAHPAKLGRSTDGKLPVPTGYHISDSANFVNKPDSGLTIYRSDDDEIQIGCWKCRVEGLLGRRGTLTF